MTGRGILAPQPTEKGTCPTCGQTAWLSVYDGRTLLHHHVPRYVYKDDRGCRGAGRVAIEKRRR